MWMKTHADWLRTRALQQESEALVALQSQLGGTAAEQEGNM